MQGLITAHYHPFLPMVSDTGNYVPESATFSFAISLIGILCKSIDAFRRGST